MVALVKESVVAGVADIPTLVTITDNATTPVTADCSSPYCCSLHQHCYKCVSLVNSLKFYSIAIRAQSAICSLNTF